MARIKSSARTVDMLGRQQIAGIQNAVGELFKNAHDAYADHIVIDYFEGDERGGGSFVVVRDDGVGMTREDFEGKWLVLGTDSKSVNNRNQHFKPLNKETRPLTGEKGIGRLSIALLGRQVVVLTRAEREDGVHDLVVSYVHWGLFELPGITLDNIEIPVLTIANGQLPSALDLGVLKNAVLENLSALQLEPHIKKKFESDLESFLPDPQAIDAFYKSREDDALSLGGAATGTHFIIGPSNPVMKIEMDYEDRADDYSFRKQLLAFYDQTFSSKPPPPIETSFRRWQPGDLVGTELLDSSTFFQADDLENKSDHLLDGTVNEYGQFTGSLRVYEKEYPSLSIPWRGAGGRRTRCGPFKVTFAYLMGRNSESIVPDAEYNEINAKLDYLGGMYVYRDGVRVLPYGDHSYDWLEVEKRRTKGAGYYFFSFRRMFGAVTLTKNSNGELQEKAGREGFQQNEAYRQLREILVNLLINLAADFFRKSGEYSAAFERTQNEIRKRNASLEKQQKRALTRRRQFGEQLASFDNLLTSSAPHAQVASLRAVARSRIEAAGRIEDQDRAAHALIRAEQDAVLKLDELRSSMTVKRPTGVGLTKDLAREWELYQLRRAKLEQELFLPYQAEIAATLGEVAAQARIYVDQRKRLEQILRSMSEQRTKDLAAAVREANESATRTRNTVLEISERARLALDSAVRSIEADLNSTDISILPFEKVEGLRAKWENQLSEVETRHRDALTSARDMLAALAENLRESDGEEPAQIMEAMEQKMLALEEDSDSDFEMVQLGLAVAIINHEFSASIKRVRKSIRDLGQLSSRSSPLKPLYESIRSNFEHLDGHLNLFTPLQKRLNRVAQDISGKSIRNYVNEVFSGRFERHAITLQVTQSFLEAVVRCFPSTLYPAFINLIDNAVFWLDTVQTERTIRLDARDGILVIANNGVHIEERDVGRIFERGYSRKPSGRGLGLYISAKALASERMSLSIGTPPVGFSVSFEIAINAEGAAS